MVAPLLQDSLKEPQAQVQALATNLDPKPIKVPSMLDYVPSTGLANSVESGRRPDSVSNHSLEEFGKYRLGRPQRQRFSVRKQRADKAPPTAKVKRTAAATLAAIRAPLSTLPTLLAHRLRQLPHLPNVL